MADVKVLMAGGCCRRARIYFEYILLALLHCQEPCVLEVTSTVCVFMCVV